MLRIVTSFTLTAERIVSAGLSGVLKNLGNTLPFAIFSFPKKETEQVQGKFKIYLQQYGYGWIDLKGYLIEGVLLPRENPILVLNVEKENGIKLSREFDLGDFIIVKEDKWALIDNLTGNYVACNKNGTIFPTNNPKDENMVSGLIGDVFNILEGIPSADSQYHLDLSNSGSECFYSMKNFKPFPPVSLHPSGVRLRTNCPSASSLDCWIPLTKLGK
jgi:hypothetical protein